MVTDSGGGSPSKAVEDRTFSIHVPWVAAAYSVPISPRHLIFGNSRIREKGTQENSPQQLLDLANRSRFNDENEVNISQHKDRKIDVTY
jgi:hypothetical protein